MRFILNEGAAKFILNERFILNEDTILTEDTASSALNVATHLNDEFAQLPTKIQELSDQTKTEKLANRLQAVNAAKEAVDIALADPDITADAIQDELNKYLVAINTFKKNSIDTINPKTRPEGFADAKTDFETAIKDLSKKVQATPFKVKPAKDAYTTLAQSIEAIPLTPKATENDIEELKKTSDDLINRIQKINYIPKEMSEFLTNDTSSLGEFALAGKAVYDTGLEILNFKGNRGTVSGDNLKSLQNLYTQFNTELNKLEDTKVLKGIHADINQKRADAEKQAAEAEEKAKKDELASGTDWAALYKKCQDKVDFDTFWEKYYTEEWGKKSDIIKGFSTAFTDDLKEIGWDAITNPVIAFMKRPEISALIGNKFTSTTYDILHNALARQELYLKDFTANASSTFGKSNLIFNLNLYDQEPISMADYLKAQARIRNNSGSFPQDISVFYGKNQENRRTVLSNIVLEDGKVTNIGDTAILSQENAKLRALNAINKLLSQTIGASAENERGTASDRDIDEFLDRVKDKDTAKKVLAYLYSVFSAGEFEANIRKLDNTTTTRMADLYDTYTPKATDIISIRNMLPTRNKDLSSAQVTLLLNGLAKKAEIIKQK